MSKLDFEDLLGTRFCNHGRSKGEGFDCYGFVIEAFKRDGKELPDLWYTKSYESIFDNEYSNIANRLIEEGKIIEVEKPEYKDIILFGNGNGRMVHIGIKLNRDDFVHCNISGVHVEKLSSYFRKERRYFRWQE